MKVNQRCIFKSCMLEIINYNSYVTLFLQTPVTWVTLGSVRDLNPMDRIVPLLYHDIHWPEEGAVSQEKD